MANTPKHQDEALELLRESLASDVLGDTVSSAEVDLELRVAGGDPAAIGAQGVALAQRLLEKRRLAWQETARKTIETHERGRQATPIRPLRSRQELLDEIAARRVAFEQRGLSVVTAFRKRKPEEASDEELAEFLDELEMLDAADGDDDSSAE